MRHPCPADLQRVGDIAEVDVGMRLEVVGQLVAQALERLGRPALSVRTWVASRRVRRRRRLGRLLEHHMGICPAEPEGADCRPTRLVGALPGSELGVDEEGLAAKSICGFGRSKLRLGGISS